MNISSHAFDLTTNDILSKLAEPVISNPKIFKKIDFTYLELIGHELITRKKTPFFSSNNAPIINQPNSIKDKVFPKEDFFFRHSSFKTSTLMFFYYLESMSTLLVPLIDHVENLNRRIQWLEKKLKGIPPGSNLYTREKFKLDRTKTIYFSLKVVIENPTRMGNINKYYESLLIYLIETFKRKRILIVPQHFLDSYSRINRFLADIDETFIDRFSARYLGIYIDFLLLILGENFSKSVLHIRARLMDILFTFYYNDSAKTNAKLSNKLVTQNKKKDFINSIMHFYVQVNFLTDFNAISRSKVRYRLFMSKFLNESLLVPSFQDAFKLNEKTQEMSDFIIHLLMDLNSHLEESFINFEKIKKLKIEVGKRSGVFNNRSK